MIVGLKRVRSRPVRRSIFALLALTTTAHAQLVIFTYDQWERLSPGLQEIYLAGASDWLSTVAAPLQLPLPNITTTA
jgi:hypothetical protein